jgi:hypothetical protein
MSFRFKTSGRAILLVWETAPTLADVSELQRIVGSARKAAKERVIFIGVVPPHVNTYPGSETRSAMSQGMPLLAEHCEAFHMVIQGTDLQRSLLRGLLRALIIISRGGRLHLYATVEAAVAAASEFASSDVRNAYAAADLAGLLVRAGDAASS